MESDKKNHHPLFHCCTYAEMNPVTQAALRALARAVEKRYISLDAVGTTGCKVSTEVLVPVVLDTQPQSS